MAQMQHRVFTVLCIGALAAACASAAPFAKTFRFTQPDGRQIEVWGEGDEFRAVFEHRGYTIVWDQATKAYTYAKLSADGTELIPTRLLVGRDDPALNGLPQHLRIAPEAAAEQARQRFERWDAGMQIRRRWQERKSRLQLLRAQMDGGVAVMAPPGFTTTGTKVGLCLLIDFPDAEAIVPREDVHEFCNGDGYTGYGNNGSVKEYFYDVSGGLLTYTNVVTAYVRMERPHSFYCDISKDAGEQANILIRDAIAILKAQPNYEAEILPTFESLSLEDEGELVACNVFYAGSNGGRWSYGLWPHSWSLYDVGAQNLGNDQKIFKYQITDIGAGLEIGTFCHENGHMLCGYPDIYDYQYDSEGGAGGFCLMNSGGHGHNPVQVCAYLKYASGWADIEEVTWRKYVVASLAATLGEPGFNKFYRVAKPGVDTEYYLFENRQQDGRDALIPGSGIAIWHIDELGDRDNQSLVYNTAHRNYECTLMQADNLWHFQNNMNSGDEQDLYYEGNPASGYQNRFSDQTEPSAHWWDGTRSRIKAERFSASGPVMTFVFQVDPPDIVTPSQLPTGRVGTPYELKLGATGYGVPFVWGVLEGSSLPPWLNLSETGVLSGMPDTEQTVQFDVTVTDAGGQADTNTFHLSILPAWEVPVFETFEEPPASFLSGWQQEFVTNSLRWVYRNVATYPPTACRGTNSAVLVSSDPGPYVTRLISPRIVFPADAKLPQLSFWHVMAPFNVFQDHLRVYYKSAYEDEWTLLKTYRSAVNVWRQQTIALPNPSATYYLCFEGVARNGHGVHIDDVHIMDAYYPLAWQTPDQLPDAFAREPYQYALIAGGGIGPYSFELAAGSQLPQGLSLSTNGVISGIASNLETCVFSVVLTDVGEAVTLPPQTFTLEVAMPRVVLFSEYFETGGAMPQRWVQQAVTNSLLWAFQDGGGNGDTFHIAEKAYEGSCNAVLWSDRKTNQVTRLITKNGINLGASPATPRLEFWHCMRELHDGVSMQQDELRVYVRSSVTADWTLLATYTNNVPEWTLRTLALPNPSTNYFLAFEGTARFGHGVCIDNVRVTDGSLAPIITTLGTLPGANLGVAYTQTLRAIGGVEPYAWELVSGALPSGLSLAADGVLDGVPTAAGQRTLTIRVVDAMGVASTNTFSLAVANFRRLPLVEDFESSSGLPPGWTQSTEYPPSSTLKWQVGNGSPSGTPSSAHSGTRNLYLRSTSTSEQRVRLISPTLDMGENMTDPQLSFWLCMAPDKGRDEVRVLVKTNAAEEVWTTILTIKTSVPAWSNVVVSLPSPSPSYVIAFDGVAEWGKGVCLDDIEITGTYASTGGYTAWQLDNFGPGMTDEAIIGMTADPDGDGLANWLEYAMALDPNTPDSEFAMDGGVTAGYLTLSYRKNPLATDVIFTVEACDDLLVQDWTELGVSMPLPPEDHGTWLWYTFRHDIPVTDAPRRFLRLKISMP